MIHRAVCVLLVAAILALACPTAGPPVAARPAPESSWTAPVPRSSPVMHASNSANAAQAATRSRRFFTRGNLAHRR